MISRVSTLAFNGIDIVDVDVQVQVNPGVPNFIIVGLADKAITESKERVRAALQSIGLGLPPKRILINLSPADLIKEGSHFDLAIALSILVDMKVIPADMLSEYMIVGELALDGSILPVSGVLPAAIGASSRDMGLICARDNGSEAAWSGNEKILAAGNLLDLINHFKGRQVLSAPELNRQQAEPTYPDMKDIIGQNIAKRVLEIAAAGGHNLLMIGPPGTGKSMLAERMPGILPEQSVSEILESSMIASISGRIKDGCLERSRPFRSPHHTCTQAAMVGGGSGRKVKPGEISLAHNGVLFLDELPEFGGIVLESLRQPLESRKVSIARSGNSITYPANFQLIAAMNPCKCGYLADAKKSCSKAPICGDNYRAKISGPMLDRFDLHVEVSDEGIFNLITDDQRAKPEASSEIKDRVVEARRHQLARYQGYGLRTNSEMNNQMITDYAIPVDEGKEMLNEAASKYKMSMRSYYRILKVARTIADLDRSKWVKKHHISEALTYKHFQVDYEENFA